jgi:very-short-patch-repair endonuclease
VSENRSFRVARGLRRAATPQEKRLWEQLRDRRLAGLKFRRQHPLHGYVVDFYCAERVLAVELDGAVHRDAEQGRYDQFRGASLTERGVTILRFTNDEVDTNLPAVARRIREVAQRLPPQTAGPGRE